MSHRKSFRLSMNSDLIVWVFIGRSLRCYDVWADAWNMVSCMDMHGLRTGSQITDENSGLLNDDIFCQPQGLVEAEAKGESTTWFLAVYEQAGIVQPEKDRAS